LIRYVRDIFFYHNCSDWSISLNTKKEETIMLTEMSSSKIPPSLIIYDIGNVSETGLVTYCGGLMFTVH